MRTLLDSVVGRAVMTVPDGKSGNLVERLTLADGSGLVVKHVRPRGDWLMRAFRDDGRAVQLWTAGILAQVPPPLDHAVVGVEPDGDGWLLVMRDVSADLIAQSVMLTRAGSRRVLRAAAALHDAFRGRPLEGLCRLEDRYAALSPATARREAAGAHPLPRLIGRGWERFADLVDGDVGDAVFAVLAEPDRLATQLARHEQTLIHGDLKFGNLGLAGGRVIALDWGTQTGLAPPAVEYAWYLALNASRIGASKDELLDDVRAVAGPRHDEAALRLALFGGLVQLGWNKALDAADHPDEAVRRREAADLRWWLRRAEEALERWSPS